MSFAIIPHKDEFAVCHMGQAKVCGQDNYQTVWVVDHIAPTMEMAIELQLDLDRKARVRAAQIVADLKSLERRR